MAVKTGKVLGFSGGLLIASSMIIFVNAWAMFIAWIFVLIGFLVGVSLDRQGLSPEVPWVLRIIMTPTILALAVAIPLGLRYVEFSYLSAQIPKHSALRLVGKSWSPLAGDGYAGFVEVYTTTESAEVIYNYFHNKLQTRGWRIGNKSGWRVDKFSKPHVTADGFLVDFSNDVDKLWISYGSPHVDNIDLPKGTYPVTISYQRRFL